MELQKNPFYILDISCDATRSQIISAADERSFLFDAEECTNAQNILINPSKRIAAELGWFLDVDSDTLLRIGTQLEKQEEISVEGLHSLSRLNAVIYNFKKDTSVDPYEVGFSIASIDEQFENLDIYAVNEVINNHRKIAGFPAVNPQDVSSELAAKRQEISNIIGEKFARLNKESLVELATVLAEKYVANSTYKDGAIISDAIDQYELAVQSDIEELTNKIGTHIERIKRLANKDAYEQNIQSLIRRVSDWDGLAQPLQIKAQATGLSHVISEDLAAKIRELAIFLHNEKEMTELSLKLVAAMRKIFAESPVFSNMFSDDYQLLSKENIMRGQSAHIKQAFTELDQAGRELKESSDPSQVYKYINQIVRIDNILLKEIDRNLFDINDLRETVCSIGRNVAIELHNDYDRLGDAKSLLEFLVSESTGLPKIQAQLKDDLAQLEKNRLALGLASGTNGSVRNDYNLSRPGSGYSQPRNQGQKRPTVHTSYSHSSLPWYIRLAILAALIFVFAWIGKGCSSSENKGGYSTINRPATTYTSPATTAEKQNDSTPPTVKRYEVTLNKNGGTGGTSTVTVSYGASMPTATAPSRLGYTFEGYYDSAGNQYYDSNMSSAHSWTQKKDGTLTARWKQISEKQYTSGMSVNTPVYIDIVSIFPSMGIYTEGSSTYKEFVCECKTSSGMYVWVHMTCSEYKKYFDSSVSTSIYNASAETKTFNISKRIHGTTVNAESVLSGLSSDTGKIIIQLKSVN